MQKLWGIAFALWCTGSIAAIEDHGEYTLDTETGFKWIDATVTRGKAKNSIAEQFAYDGEFSGCRFATRDEVDALLPKLGLSPVGYQCAGAAYCAPPLSGEEEALEDAIRLLGDTNDAKLDAGGSATDIAPDGAGYLRAFIGDHDPAPGIRPSSSPTVFLTDKEYVYRATGLPKSDANDRIVTSAPNLSTLDENGNVGSLLICDRWPVWPRGETATIDFQEFSSGEAGPLETAGFALIADTTLSDGGDIAAVSRRCKALNSGSCSTSMSLSRIDGQPFAFHAAELQFNGNCTSHTVRVQGVTASDHLVTKSKTVSDSLNVITHIASRNGIFGYADWLRVKTVTFSYSAFSGPQDCALEIDNIVVGDVNQAIIDLDPSSEANLVRPLHGDTVTVQLKSTAIANGDSIDFDAAQIQADTVRLGRLGAVPLTAPIVGDLDTDGDTDYEFSFDALDAGINCLSDHVVLSGTVGEDVAFSAQDSVQGDCDMNPPMDVEADDPDNTVFPNDDYTFELIVLRTNVDDGDPFDFNPNRIIGSRIYVGPNSILSTPAELGDFDGDGDEDKKHLINMADTGITCDDTQLAVTGTIGFTSPFYFDEGQEYTDFTSIIDIETAGCETNNCHP